MLDFDWMINTLKEAIEDEDWELVREVMAYLEEDDVFEQYKGCLSYILVNQIVQNTFFPHQKRVLLRKTQHEKRKNYVSKRHFCSFG